MWTGEAGFTGGAGADSKMAAGHAHGAGAALRVSEARVHALVAHARQVVRALRVQLAFTLCKNTVIEF
jgi:hypothetical protein